jgi:hypothetical protein
MATTKKRERIAVQAYVPIELAHEARLRAEREDRSLSGIVRQALRNLRQRRAAREVAGQKVHDVVNVPAADLALAAARTRDLADRLDDDARTTLIEAWGGLLEGARSAGAAELALIEFRAKVENQLAARRRTAAIPT